MLVWQHIAKGTLLDKQGVIEWLSKQGITACEIENIVCYTKIPIECNRDCDNCMNQYLDRNTERKGFNEVSNKQGEIQLRLW